MKTFLFVCAIYSISTASYAAYAIQCQTTVFVTVQVAPIREGTFGYGNIIAAVELDEELLVNGVYGHGNGSWASVTLLTPNGGNLVGSIDVRQTSWNPSQCSQTITEDDRQDIDRSEFQNRTGLSIKTGCPDLADAGNYSIKEMTSLCYNATE